MCRVLPPQATTLVMVEAREKLKHRIQMPMQAHAAALVLLGLCRAQAFCHPFARRVLATDMQICNWT